MGFIDRFARELADVSEKEIKQRLCTGSLRSADAFPVVASLPREMRLRFAG